MKKPRRNPYINPGRPAKRCTLDADNPVEMMIRYYDHRLEIRGGGLWILDKHPVSLDQLMQRFNRERTRYRLPQVGSNPKWLVD